MCARCNLALSANIADHIVPAGVAVQQARDSGRYPYDKYAGYYLLSNLQGLCRPCHGVKTLEDKAHVGPWPEQWLRRKRRHQRRFGPSDSEQTAKARMRRVSPILLKRKAQKS